MPKITPEVIPGNGFDKPPRLRFIVQFDDGRILTKNKPIDGKVQTVIGKDWIACITEQSCHRYQVVVDPKAPEPVTLRTWKRETTTSARAKKSPAIVKVIGCWKHFLVSSIRKQGIRGVSSGLFIHDLDTMAYRVILAEPGYEPLSVCAITSKGSLLYVDQKGRQQSLMCFKLNSGPRAASKGKDWGILPHGATQLVPAEHYLLIKTSGGKIEARPYGGDKPVVWTSEEKFSRLAKVTSFETGLQTLGVRVKDKGRSYPVETTCDTQLDYNPKFKGGGDRPRVKKGASKGPQG